MADIALNIYSSVELAQVLQQDERFQFKPLLSSFFGTFYQSQTNVIMYEKISNNRSIAPLVIPEAVGMATKRSDSEAISFSTGYIKLRDRIDPSSLTSRTAGEALMGSLTMEERFAKSVAELTVDHYLRCLRLQEVMAAEILRTGKLVLESEKFPKTTLDFRRDASKTVVLSGAALWSASTGTPAKNLEAWISAASRPIKAVIFSQTAWDAFKADPVVEKWSNTLYAGEVSALAKSLLQKADLAENDMIRVGSMPNNGVEFFVYKGTYVDNAGVEHPYLADGELVGVPSPKLGVTAHGAIMDYEASFAAIPYYSKMWADKDLGSPVLLTQSAPVLLHLAPNATFYAKVL